MADGMPSSQVSDLSLFIKKGEGERDESEDQARLLNLVFLTQCNFPTRHFKVGQTAGSVYLPSEDFHIFLDAKTSLVVAHVSNPKLLIEFK